MVKSTMTGTVPSSARGRTAAAIAQNEQTTEERSTLEQQQIQILFAVMLQMYMYRRRWFEWAGGCLHRPCCPSLPMVVCGWFQYIRQNSDFWNTCCCWQMASDRTGTHRSYTCCLLETVSRYRFLFGVSLLPLVTSWCLLGFRNDTLESLGVL